MAVGKSTFGQMHPVAGFKLGTVAAGVKVVGRRDLVVMEIAAGSTVAGTFTKNAFCAAPVQICKQNLQKLKQPLTQAGYFITNTGFANAGTGDKGYGDAQRVCETLAQKASVDSAAVFPFSTGVIGEPLPVNAIVNGMDGCLAGLSEQGWEDAAHGIMTTDTRPKGASVVIELDGKKVTLSGLSKGAGMIQPNMATMLAYVATDAAVEAGLLQQLAVEATQMSFNSITVDSDTSTNDCCMLVATGQSGVTIAEGDNLEKFKHALQQVYLQLAQAIIRDGEGATKFVAIEVEQALSLEEARQVAYTVANSPLVKTALFASDPNWGRVLAAVGRAGVVELDVNGVSVWINQVLIAENGGVAQGYREQAGAEAMKKEEISIRIGLGRGQSHTTVWTTDFSYDYVKINAEYRS